MDLLRIINQIIQPLWAYSRLNLFETSFDTLQVINREV